MIDSPGSVAVRAGRRFQPSARLDFMVNMKKSITVMPKRRGRPATGRDPSVVVRFPPVLTEAVDAWARKAGDDVSRSEAIRRLVELGLKRREGTR